MLNPFLNRLQGATNFSPEKFLQHPNKLDTKYRTKFCSNDLNDENRLARRKSDHMNLFKFFSSFHLKMLMNNIVFESD